MSVLKDGMVKVGCQGGMKMLGRPMNVALALTLTVLASIHADITRAQVVEEGLVSYWTFDRDDIEGNTVKDLLGNNDGTMSGNPIIVEGKIGDALEFDGDDHVDCGQDDSLLLGDTDLSFGLWVKFTNLAGTNYLVGNYSAQNGKYYHIWEQDGRLIWSIDDDVTKSQIEFPNIKAGEWYHVFGVRVKGIETRLYVNGVLGVSGPDQTGDITSDAPMYFGDRFAGDRDFEGIIDEVALYNRALSDDEVFRNFEARGLGSALIPADAASDVSRDIILSWEESVLAATYDVYFGTNFNAVNTADATNPMAVLAGPSQDANTFDPGRLAFDQTYYWRVDEVNGAPDFTIYKGDVWSFTVEPIAYPISGENIDATASSVGQIDFGPEKTIDSSGLDENDLHSVEPTDMWLSGSEPLGAWIQYEFDRLHKLHEMWVWNSNQIFEGMFGFGLKSVTIEYSTDGTEWTALADVPEFAPASGTADYAHNTTVDFGGAVAKVVRLTASSNWGGVLPQYGLSEVRFVHIPVSAREPSPDSEAADVHPDVTVAWRAGREAAMHDVYVSTDQQAVIDGTAPTVSVTNASYSTTLNLGNTYYWRVDEVNEAETPAIWQGDVWDFTTQQFIVVEDFEDYNDYPPDEIYSTWLDGYENPTNGSQVGNLTPPAVETTIVHGGKQSMPLFYSNTGGAAYSEAARTFAVPQDWTKYGIETLQLWFYGTAGNTGQLYAKINGVKVPYDGDAANLAVAGWLPWDIDLTTSGVNLQSVTSLAIGIDGNAAAGTLYFDDIRLYGAPAAPTSASLVAWWRLDDHADDSSGNGHNGTVEGAPTWVSPGRDGTGACMRFGGDSDRITVESFDVTSTGIALSAWINPVSFMDDARMISKSEGGSTNLHYWAMVLSGTGEDNLQFRLRTDVGNTTSRASAEGTEVLANEWTHVAVTWDAADPVLRQYKNGIEIDSVSKDGTVVATGTDVKIGIGNQSIGALAQGPGNEIWPFDGLLDDVRVYDRGLSPTEIFQLASQ
ncbi:MAG: LamG-like jellyroll fold domain-containing protein [Planctomycetota bacterium]|jgi:hypothetical protein